MLYNKKMENNQQIIYKKNYDLKDSGNIFLFALIVPFLISLLFSLIANVIAGVKNISPSVITTNIWFLSLYSVFTCLSYFLIYIIYNKIQKIDYKAIKINFKLSWHTYLLMIIIGVVALFGVQYFISVIDLLLEKIGFNLQGSSINPINWGTFFLSVFVLAVLPAIGEELIFRGIILNGLRQRFGDVASIFLSALMFALMHQNFQQLIYPFILGSIMAWAVVRSGSLVSSVIIHFTNNFLVVLMQFITNMTGWTMIPTSFKWWFYVISILLLILTILVIFLIDRFYFKHKSKDTVETQKEKIPVIFYVSIAVASFLFLLNTILSFQ